MTDNRRIRVFVSSTFRDMVEERDELMTHTWPEMRRFCRDRQVEFVEVDLRWGIAEEQSTRKETLKLCLNEIRACRPYFVGILGERYGWTPTNDAFTADLVEEQPWLKELSGKSITELEILHGVLNNPDMADRSFFYFRDQAYAQNHGADFLPQDSEAADQQWALKTLIRQTCGEKHIPLRENYSDPRTLAALVLDDLKGVVTTQFPIEEIPDRLTREARDHEAFAEVRRRTYIGRPSYFEALDRHASSDGAPLILLGDSGSGKSALLANWLQHWRVQHPQDFVFQHYIGGTPESVDHWRLMTRLIAEIKRWTGDPEELRFSHDDVFKDFPVWLIKARLKAERDAVRAILVLDALNQLEDRDHARLLGWLPSHSFGGPLRLIVSTLPVNPSKHNPQMVVDDPMKVVAGRGWDSLHIEPLISDERLLIIAEYLELFGKKLDAARLERLALAPGAANPLYLKILLDELRVTGTHDRLDARLDGYLGAADVPTLLEKVLARYQCDYERDRPGLVGDALGSIWAARRGLTEIELLRLLKPPDLPQLPASTWSPLRAALEEGLVDRGGLLNFAHDYLRTAVETAFVPDKGRRDALRLGLADYFEEQPVSERSCDELPWLLRQADATARLRACLLNVDRFLEIHARDQGELMQYWVDLGEERTMGSSYRESFGAWSDETLRDDTRVLLATNVLSSFLHAAALYSDSEPLMRLAVAIAEQSLGRDHPDIAGYLSNLAQLLGATNRLAEAEPLMRRVLGIWERSHGADRVHLSTALNNLAGLLVATGRFEEAEPLLRRGLELDEQHFGPEHPKVGAALNNLAELLREVNRLAEAETMLRRALDIWEKQGHPDFAHGLNNLASLLQATNRLEEAEPLYRRAVAIVEQSLGPDHPQLANPLHNLAGSLQTRKQFAEAEPLMRRVVSIFEKSLGANHPNVATVLNSLALLLGATNRRKEAEALMRRALAIDEQSFGLDHPVIARDLHNLAPLLEATNRLDEAERLMRRALAIFEKGRGPEDPDVALCLMSLSHLLLAMNRLNEAEPLIQRSITILVSFTRATGYPHPHLQRALEGYGELLQRRGQNREQILVTLRRLAPEFFSSAPPESEESQGDLDLENPDTLRRLNNFSHILRVQGHVDLAEPLDRQIVDATAKILGKNHLLTIHRRNNLVLTLIMLGKLAEARGLLIENWQTKAEPFANTTPRVAFLAHLLALLESQTNTPFLGQLKALLSGPGLPVAQDVAVPWDNAYFIEKLRSQLPPGCVDFLTVLVAALNDRAKVANLDRFPEWRNQLPIPLDTPWPGE